MLYETLSQPLIALFLLLGGFASGIIFDIANVIFLANNSKKTLSKILRNILDIICVIFSGLIFYLIVLNSAYGDVRIYQIVLFVLALIIQRVSVGKLVAKLLSWCYNKIEKLLKSLVFRIKALIQKSTKTKEEDEKINS